MAQKLTIFHISGTITLPDGTPLSGVALTVSGLDQPVVTGANGTFDIELPEGWAGSITPSCPMYGFVPASFEYPSLAESKTGQNFQASPMLTLSGERLTEKAWIITKSYCRVSVTMDKTEPLAHEFVLLKKTGSSEFQTVQTFTAADFSNNTWTYLDMNVEEDRTVSYRVTVKNRAGTVIYRSPDTTL